MMNTLSAKPLPTQALEAVQALDRRKAAELLRRDIDTAPPGGDRWRSVARLAARIGERELELEALYRYLQTEPQTLDHLLAYGQALVNSGRSAEALGMLDNLPEEVLKHPGVQHFRGMVASETGDFAKAEMCFRRVLAASPLVAQTWYALATVKTFKPGDPDIALMEAIRPETVRLSPDLQSRFLYALGKAYDDAGDTTRALAVYNEGAEAMRRLQPYEPVLWRSLVDRVIADWSPQNLARLTLSGADSRRVTFVTGLPRSGTTLVEQILTSHSEIAGGVELNVSEAVLLPVGDMSFQAARAYEMRARATDPWGELGRDYLGMAEDYFGPQGRVIDKTLNQSARMGLLLHMLPNARVIWLRRDPEDNALSIFRTHFRDSLAWSWRMADIAAHMRGEDALHAHWAGVFGDRILTVPYEGLVEQPDLWTRRMLAHIDLGEEQQVFAPQDNSRSVTTASVAQVRAPISTSRIGSAAAYGGFMDDFRRAYNN